MNIDDLVVSKLIDKKNICNYKNMQTNTKFLNGSELLLCLENLKFDYNYKTYGGYPDCERQIIVFYPDYIDPCDIDYPIDVLKLDYRKKLSHRDVLGSIMGLGIKREMIGDILTFDDCAYIFTMREISEFISTNLIKVSNQTVSIEKADINEIENREIEFKIIKDTVQSIRLDSIVSSGFLMSRSKAVDIIRGSNVYLNNVICTKTDQKINALDKISIRGKGKIILSDILGKSKKDRIFIEIKKFI